MHRIKNMIACLITIPLVIAVILLLRVFAAITNALSDEE